MESHMASKFVYKNLRFPVILAVLGFLTFGFVCTGMAEHVSMHKTGVNSFAITSIDQECCNTAISKNVETWKGALLVLPKEMRDGLTLLILSLALVFTAALIRFKHDHDDPPVISLRLYDKNNPDITFFNHLKLSFARGILNPKIY